MFFLTSGAEGAGSLCERLTQAGLGHLTATVGQSLSYPQEQIISDSVSRLAGHAFAPLTVLLVEGTPAAVRRLPGPARRSFPAGDVPMTKQEVRAAAIGKLAVRDGETYWDVGAGTGSVSVELALLAPHSTVCAVECGGEACSLIRANREKFGVYNLELTRARPGGSGPAARPGRGLYWRQRRGAARDSGSSSAKKSCRPVLHHRHCGRNPGHGSRCHDSAGDGAPDQPSYRGTKPHSG